VYEPVGGEGKRVKASTCARYLVFALLGAAIIMVAVAFFVTGFSIRVVGLLGRVQEMATEGSSTRYFSPLSIAEMMHGEMPDDVGQQIGTWALIIVMLSCTTAVPIAQACVLMVTWVGTHELPALKKLVNVNEILASFQYIEVYLIAVIVGCAQIPFVCTLLVGSSCDDIQPYLNLMVWNEKMDVATCFSMQPVIHIGLWLHFFGSILLYISSVVVRNAAGATIDAHDPLRLQQQKAYSEAQSKYYKDRMENLLKVSMIVGAGEAPKEPVKEVAKTPAETPASDKKQEEPTPAPEATAAV